VYIENNYANSFVNYELSKFQSNKNLIQTTYLKSLADYLGSESFESLEKSTKEFMGKGFVITDENYMKIGMILQKASLKIPIVIMGESGCGKTYLTQFICKGLLGDELKMLTLYSGVTETMFIKDIKEAFELAEKLSKEDELKKKESQSAYFRPRNVWVFFDEFNTSSLQSIVAEVMVDRVCSIDNSIRRVPDNVVFISCCNPYRKKTQREDIGLAPTKTETSLSHRVNPVPDRLLNYVWDFGQLTEEDDKAHIRNMVMEAQAKVTQKIEEYDSSPDFLFGNGGDDGGASTRDVQE
jgi:MoxR-like ATPase